MHVLVGRLDYRAPIRKWNPISLYALQTLVQGKENRFQVELADELRALGLGTHTHR